mmetsp:Transcript_79813/g.208098  ORF Transcript_79813/g.208098 Transcript_79813/m.208098 type:complete len:208 (+) Transcript_79813:71-694(+)
MSPLWPSPMHGTTCPARLRILRRCRTWFIGCWPDTRITDHLLLNCCTSWRTLGRMGRCSCHRRCSSGETRIAGSTREAAPRAAASRPGHGHRPRRLCCTTQSRARTGGRSRGATTSPRRSTTAGSRPRTRTACGARPPPVPTPSGRRPVMPCLMQERGPPVKRMWSSPAVLGRRPSRPPSAMRWRPHSPQHRWHQLQGREQPRRPRG